MLGDKQKPSSLFSTHHSTLSTTPHFKNELLPFLPMRILVSQSSQRQRRARTYLGYDWDEVTGDRGLEYAADEAMEEPEGSVE